MFRLQSTLARVPLKPSFAISTKSTLSALPTIAKRTYIWHTRAYKPVPDPYTNTHNRPPPPPGRWIDPVFGPKYYWGIKPEQQKVIDAAQKLGLPSGLERFWDCRTDQHQWITYGSRNIIPGKYFGYALFGVWFYIYWDMKGPGITETWTRRYESVRAFVENPTLEALPFMKKKTEQVVEDAVSVVSEEDATVIGNKQ